MNKKQISPKKYQIQEVKIILRQNNLKKFLPLPNEIFSLGLSVGEIAVYAYLLKCENRKTYNCYPSYKNIAGSLNLCQNSVRKYVAGLEDKHLIETEPTTVTLKNGAKRNGNLLYTIRPINEAVDYFNERQIINAQFEFARSELLKRTYLASDCRNNPEKCSFEN